MCQSAWTIGPMLHFNISEKKVKPSFAIEAAYWNYTIVPYSVDMAIEFEKKKIRLYTEGQTGIGFAGVSFGPVIEIQTEAKKIKLGYQGSVWSNYFLGFDYRVRKIDNKKHHCPGIYAKLPFHLRDENGEKRTSNNSNSSWDWDD